MHDLGPWVCPGFFFFLLIVVSCHVFYFLAFPCWMSHLLLYSFGWMIKKKSSFKEWWLFHSWMIACLLLETQLQLELPLHFLVAMPSLWPTFLSHLGGRWGWETVGEQHVLKKVTVCCFAVLHLVKVVTPKVPTFQPIAIHLLLPHPLPLVHPPLGATSGNLPLALHQSVQTLLHLYNTPGKASWSHLSCIITVNASGNT